MVNFRLFSSLNVIFKFINVSVTKKQKIMFTTLPNTRYGFWLL